MEEKVQSLLQKTNSSKSKKEVLLHDKLEKLNKKILGNYFYFQSKNTFFTYIKFSFISISCNRKIKSIEMQKFKLTSHNAHENSSSVKTSIDEYDWIVKKTTSNFSFLTLNIDFHEQPILNSELNKLLKLGNRKYRTIGFSSLTITSSKQLSLLFSHFAHGNEIAFDDCKFEFENGLKMPKKYAKTAEISFYNGTFYLDTFYELVNRLNTFYGSIKNCELEFNFTKIGIPKNTKLKCNIENLFSNENDPYYETEDIVDDSSATIFYADSDLCTDELILSEDDS